MRTLSVTIRRNTGCRGFVLLAVVLLFAAWIIIRGMFAASPELPHRRSHHLSAAERFNRSRQEHLDTLGEANPPPDAGIGVKARDRYKSGPVPVPVHMHAGNFSESHVIAKRSADLTKCINIVFILTNIANREAYIHAFLRSLLSTTQSTLCLHIIADPIGKGIASMWIVDAKRVSVNFLDSKAVANMTSPFLEAVRPSFSTGKRNYYNDMVFYVAPILYEVLPSVVDKVIFLDTDLRFKTDVAELYAQFELFMQHQPIGMAYENQPVYQHMLSDYIREHPTSWIGRPHPHGIIGFNSGVMLQDLSKIRNSNTYTSYLDGSKIKELTVKYSFSGHLGGQDLFTLISLEERDLFYVLPCQWNRQLCQFWKTGYAQIFDKYFNCPGRIHVYHGNCHMPIPDDKVIM